MKALYTWALLAGAGILPACTVHHYHGGAPDSRSTRVVTRYRTDTVYVPTTRVVTQPVPSQPPVRGGYNQPGATTTANPPVRNPPVRTASPGPRIRTTGGQSGNSGSMSPSGTTSTSTTVTASTGNGHGQTPPAYQTGGIKSPPRAGTATPITQAPTATEVVTPSTSTGGIKGAAAEDQPGGSTTPPVVISSTGHSTPGTGAGTSMSASDAPGSAAGAEKAPALVFSKMQCRGTCPAYTATIWPDGRVRYEGQQHVARLGTYELRMEPAALASIQQQAHGLGFSELQETYASGVTDIPATVLTMYLASGAKTVSVEDSAPAEVQALFDSIDSTILQLVANAPEERVNRRRGK